MAVRTPRERGTGEPRVPGLGALWLGLLAPPVIWLARLSASYLLVPLACRSGSTWALNAVTGAALLAVAASGAVALRALRRSTAPRGAAPIMQRARFLAMMGVLVAALFFAVIVAEGLANLLVDPCLTGGGTI